MDLKNVKAIILAGGFGTRLKEVVLDVPKPLAPIVGRPFLEYQINYLKDQGIYRITLAIHYLPDKFKEHFQPEVQQTEAVLPAIVQPGYFYSFMYQGGEVKANSQIGKIEVSMNHPNLKRVATLLTKLSLQNSGTIYVI